MPTSYATVTRLRDDTMDRIRQAFEKVQDRLRRATAVLEKTGLGYAVIGGNAVIHWINQADPAAYRFTQDVDILIRRADLPIMIQAMESAGFRYRHVRGIDAFLDGPQSRFQDAVHLLFASEKVRPADLAPTAAVEESIPGNGYRVLALEALVRMKLTSYRLKDQTHLDDLLRAGLIDPSCLDGLSPELAERFQKILDQFEPDLPDSVEAL